MSKEHLWDWRFCYNPYISKYMAAPREHQHELANGDKGNVLYATTVKKLEQLIDERTIQVPNSNG